MRIKKYKVCTPVEVTWLDACFYSDFSEISDKAQKDGGEMLKIIGYYVGHNANGLVLCGELDENGKPNRDINLIPLTLVRGIKKLT